MASGATSTWGRPYPLSSDAPSVHTDIQALANSLETTPLYPTTAVTSRTGASGESVAVSPSQTLTLPASPVKGDRIQVIALGTVTATTPVTVATAGGKVVNGVGLSAASSFLLGAPNANATLQYDGTAWRVIGGGQDTGHLFVVSLAAGVAFSSNPHAGFRLVGNRVQGAGYLSTTAPISSNTVLFNLPLAAMEPRSITDLMDISGGINAYFQPATIGIQNQSAISAGQLIVLSGITYPIDS